MENSTPILQSGESFGSGGDIEPLSRAKLPLGIISINFDKNYEDYKNNINDSVTHGLLRLWTKDE